MEPWKLLKLMIVFAICNQCNVELKIYYPNVQPLQVKSYFSPSIIEMCILDTFDYRIILKAKILRLAYDPCECTSIITYSIIGLCH